MDAINATVALAAASVILLGIFSAQIERSPVSLPLLSLLAGVAAGPIGLGLVDPETWPNPEKILREVAHVALAISVMGIAVRTPPQSYRTLIRPVALLLTAGMAVMWLVSSLLAFGVLDLAPLAALAVGAAVAPTDPVVASSIVSGGFADDHLPDRLRSTLSLESGANDGLSYLFFLLPVVFMTASDPATALGRWLVEAVLQGVLLGAVGGAALGWLTARAAMWAQARDYIGRHSLLILTVALSLLALTGAKLLGSDGILASFAAGAAFNLAASRNDDFAAENVQETISKLFNAPIFVLLGLALPVDGWMALGAPSLALALAVLALRRPLALLLLGAFMGGGLARRDLVFLGWFGPIGVAAMFYALDASERMGDATIWHATSLVIAVSIVVHGITAAPAVRKYART